MIAMSPEARLAAAMPGCMAAAPGFAGPALAQRADLPAPPPPFHCNPPHRTGLFMVVASALSAAGVQFTLPPFAPGDANVAADAQAVAALEAADLAAGVGLPPLGVTGKK